MRVGVIQPTACNMKPVPAMELQASEQSTCTRLLIKDLRIGKLTVTKEISGQQALLAHSYKVHSSQRRTMYDKGLSIIHPDD
jgi:hypothetical protein